MAEQIEGIKLITHNANGVDRPDDPSYPWLLEANLRPPEFMDLAFVFFHGGSEIVRARGMTEETLVQWAEKIGLYNHPRLRRMTITQPEA